MLRLCVERLPGFASVVGDIDASVGVDRVSLLSPGGEVEALVIAWIDLQSGWSGYALRKIDALPVLCLVDRAIERSAPASE